MAVNHYLAGPVFLILFVVLYVPWIVALLVYMHVWALGWGVRGVVHRLKMGMRRTGIW
jgi:hypothetical protein